MHESQILCRIVKIYKQGSSYLGRHFVSASYVGHPPKKHQKRDLPIPVFHLLYVNFTFKNKFAT